MAVGWFLAEYGRRAWQDRQARYCVMNEFTAAILADGGRWAEAECLGDHAIVKVRASATTLQTIANDGRIRRIPVALLDDPLSSLTTNQKSALRQAIEDLGYSAAEIQATLGADLGAKTLRDVLRFICQRRRKPRWDSGTSSIICDGIQQTCKQPEDINAEVSDT